MSKVLLIIAHKDFQPKEYGAPKNILEAAGITVVTASDRAETAVSSLTNDQVHVDIILSDVNAADYDGVFFIGGSGAQIYLENEQSYRIAKEISVTDKLWGAICYSPRILAHAGVLNKRKVTGWDEDNKLAGIFADAGAEYIRQPVIVDDNLITATGPSAAEMFGRAILEKL